MTTVDQWTKDDLVQTLTSLRDSMQYDVDSLTQFIDSVKDVQASDLAGSLIAQNVTDKVFSLYNTSNTISAAKSAVFVAQRLSSMDKISN